MSATVKYLAECSGSCLSRGCNCEEGHQHVPLPTLTVGHGTYKTHLSHVDGVDMEQAVATADRLATLPEGSHVDRSGGHAADNDDRQMRTIYILMEQTPHDDYFPLIAYTDKAAAEKERERRQTRLDAVGVIQGAAAVSTYYVHDLPLDEGTAS